MKVLELIDIGFPQDSDSVLQGINLSIEAGERVVLFGPEASGKHTILKIAGGIVRPGAGRVVIGGKDAGGLPVAYIPEDKGLISNLTLLHNAILPIVYHKRMNYAEALVRGREVMAGFGLSASADELPAVVGAGQRKLTQFARAALIDPLVFLFEQPIADIDHASNQRIHKYLRDFKAREDAGALLTTGDPTHYLDWGGRFIHMEKGRMRTFKNRSELTACEDPEIRRFLE